MVEEEKRKKKEESAVLEATLATAQAELSLSWSWATVDQKLYFVPGREVAEIIPKGTLSRFQDHSFFNFLCFFRYV